MKFKEFFFSKDRFSPNLLRSIDSNDHYYLLSNYYHDPSYWVIKSLQLMPDDPSIFLVTVINIVTKEANLYVWDKDANVCLNKIYFVNANDFEFVPLQKKRLGVFKSQELCIINLISNDTICSHRFLYPISQRIALVATQKFVELFAAEVTVKCLYGNSSATGGYVYAEFEKTYSKLKLLNLKGNHFAVCIETSRNNFLLKVWNSETSKLTNKIFIKNLCSKQLLLVNDTLYFFTIEKSKIYLNVFKKSKNFELFVGNHYNSKHSANKIELLRSGEVVAYGVNAGAVYYSKWWRGFCIERKDKEFTVILNEINSKLNHASTVCELIKTITLLPTEEIVFTYPNLDVQVLKFSRLHPTLAISKRHYHDVFIQFTPQI